MKKNVFLILMCIVTGLSGFSAGTALAGVDDDGIFAQKWNNFWEGVGHDFDRTGQSFRKTFLSVSRDDD